MNDTLVIRLPQTDIDQSTPLRWLLLDEHQQVLGDTETALEDIADLVNEHSENYRVCVVAATEDVLLTHVNIPSTQYRQVKQALPFMVEELIAQEIEMVHLALPSPLDLTGKYLEVGVVQHKVLIHWLDLLHTHHLSPTSITVDALCLPWVETSWTLMSDGDRVLIRTAENAGLACEHNDIEMIICSLIEKLEQEDDPAQLVKPQINIIETESSQTLNKVADFIRDNYSDYEVKESQYQETSNELIAKHYFSEFSHTLNLLQGGYRIDADTDTGWPRWQLAASIAGIGIATYLLLALASGVYFNQKAEELNKDAVVLYKKIFPNERRVVSPKKQMQSHLNRLAGGSSTDNSTGGFLPLIAQTAQQFGGPTEQGRLAVQQLRFDNTRNDLQLEIQSQSIEQLDRFKQLLADDGLSVDINSATEQGNNVLGRLVVRRM